MVLREGWAKLNKRQDISRSKLVGRQVVLAVLISGGMWVTGELVGRLLILLSQRTGLFDRHSHNFWKGSIFYWTVATLFILYLMMQCMRLVLKASGYAGAQRLAIDAQKRATPQGQMVLEPLPALEPTRGITSSNQTEEPSLL
jgi:hypothetical protein